MSTKAAVERKQKYFIKEKHFFFFKWYKIVQQTIIYCFSLVGTVLVLANLCCFSLVIFRNFNYLKFYFIIWRPKVFLEPQDNPFTNNLYL